MVGIFVGKETVSSCFSGEAGGLAGDLSYSIDAQLAALQGTDDGN